MKNRYTTTENTNKRDVQNGGITMKNERQYSRQDKLDMATWNGGRQCELDSFTWYCEACYALWDKVIQYRIEHNIPVNQEGDDNFFWTLGNGLNAIKEERRMADKSQEGCESPT